MRISFLSLVLFSARFCLTQSTTFQYTGNLQTYTVPQGVYEIQIEAYGASGGWNDYSGVMYDKYLPGKGGMTSGKLKVHPGQILYLNVGGKGEDAKNGEGGKGGYNGGGDGNTSGIYSGGGGGGASDVRMNGTDLQHRILVAGGGGGAAYNYADGGDNGGAGGGLTGGNGFSNHLQEDNSIGKGGTQSEGGEGGQWPSYEKGENGILGKGGNGPAGTCGTGGGGGYYGGGAGCWSGGGGGSSYTDKKFSVVRHEQGVHDGNGKIIIKTGNFVNEVACSNPIVHINRSTTLCEGESIVFNAQSNFKAKLTWDKGVENNLAFQPPVGKTTYTVTSSNKNECSYSVEVNVIPATIKATTTAGIICEGETTTLFGHGGENYIWSHGIQNGVPFKPPVGVNNYTVRSSDYSGQNQCSNEASVFVVVNKVSAVADVKGANNGYDGSIEIEAQGGVAPYSFIWTKDGNQISQQSSLTNLTPGSYEVLIVDALGCTYKNSYTVQPRQIISYNNGLDAKLSSDQKFLEVSYNGVFYYKILNSKGETVVTGTINNSGLIDVSYLPYGYYKICALDNSIDDSVDFMKW